MQACYVARCARRLMSYKGVSRVLISYAMDLAFFFSVDLGQADAREAQGV